MGNSLPTPDSEETESKKKKKKAMLQKKTSKSALVREGCNNCQHPLINMIALVILHREGILMTGCPLIS